MRITFCQSIREIVGGPSWTVPHASACLQVDSSSAHIVQNKKRTVNGQKREQKNTRRLLWILVEAREVLVKVNYTNKRICEIGNKVMRKKLHKKKMKKKVSVLTQTTNDPSSKGAQLP